MVVTKRKPKKAAHPNEVAIETAAIETLTLAEADDYYSDRSATLGDRISAARSRASLTQAGLARRIGVGARVVSGWENDRSEPRANHLAMLSGLLGVSVSWLLTGVGDGVDPPAAVPSAETKAHGIRYAAVVDDLDAARAFYVDTLGRPVEQSTETSLRLDLFGAYLELRLHDAPAPVAPLADAPTDEDGVGAPCFGVDLAWDDWMALVERLRTAGAAFEAEPAVRGVGEPRERAVFQIKDPAGNVFAFRATRESE